MYFPACQLRFLENKPVYFFEFNASKTKLWICSALWPVLKVKNHLPNLSASGWWLSVPGSIRSVSCTAAGTGGGQLRSGEFLQKNLHKDLLSCLRICVQRSCEFFQGILVMRSCKLPWTTSLYGSRGTEILWVPFRDLSHKFPQTRSFYTDPEGSWKMPLFRGVAVKDPCTETLLVPAKYPYTQIPWVRLTRAYRFLLQSFCEFL